MRLYRTSVVCACAVLFASIVAFGASETVDGITWYVNGTTGTDSSSGMSQSSAKATIQAAIDASSAGDTILVAPGTYEPIATSNKAITIRGVAGAANTIIDGDGSSRCAYLGENAEEIDTTLEGFTLTNGYVYVGWYGAGGAGVRGGTVKNCIISCCRVAGSWSGYGGEGGGANGARLECCEIRKCSALAGGGLRDGSAYGCVFAENYARDDGGATQKSLAMNCVMYGNYAYNAGGAGAGAAGSDVTNINCTIVGNHARSGGIVAGNSELRNCIVYGNSCDAGEVVYADSETSTRVLSCCMQDPNFVDAANGDYHLAEGSPCIDAGDNSFVTSETDLDGNARIVNSTVDIGCYEYGPTAIPAASGLYMVIDLSGGPSATSYPVSYLDGVPAGGWTDEYKTTKLVLRRIEPGSFKMSGDYDVTLTKPFYMGVFEVTQKQYELVTGGNPCSSTSYGKGDDYPVHYVSYDMIRGSSSGAGWPVSPTVDQTSFMGRLRDKTGLRRFDLPTEAQWEYACRAGTTTSYSFGNSADRNYMWYSSNSGSSSHAVGEKLPNDWGLYDMHGNVWEWCLDWQGSLLGGVTNPVGAVSGEGRVNRGGSWYNYSRVCDSSFRDYWYSPDEHFNDFGFRLTLTVDGSYPLPGLWTVTQYDSTSTLESVSDAEATITDSSKWARSPVTKQYPTISFANMPDGYGYNDHVEFPGTSSNHDSDYFAITAETSIWIPRAGYWTFATSSDDGQRTTITGNGVNESYGYSGYTLLHTTMRTVYIPSPGAYSVEIVYFECFGHAVLEFAIAEGSYQSFDPTVFKLVGDPASGVTLAGGETYHTVTFDANGGSVSPAEQTVSSGSSLGTLPTPTREGYSFDGWWTAPDDGVQISASTTVSSDVTYYVHWTANGYSIVYDANGGLGTVDATEATYDSEVTIAANEFTWVAHVFAGWATNALGEVVYSAGQNVMNLTAQPNGVVTLYAVWEPLVVAAPTVTPGDCTVFTEDSCTIAISCATEGATIYYGVNAVPRKRPGNIYSAPFTISDTATIYAFAEKEGVTSGNPIEVKITKQTVLGAAAGGDARSKSFPWTTGGNADWEPFKDASVDSGASVRSGVICDSADYDEWSETWLETKVPGAGTITFKWKVECEDDGTANDTWDHVVFFVDGMEIARMDGNSGWRFFSYAINGSGIHTLRWAFRKDDYNDEEFSDSAWLSEFVWKPVPPSVRGDPAAIVTGDATIGYTVKPSAASGAVEVAIPDGVDAAKVTVEVSPTVESVTPHGATIKIVKDGHDITPFLDVPAADGEGAVATHLATVKEAIVKEAIDTKCGAEIDLKPSDPSIKTAPTRPGLTYTFSEGTTLEGMTQKAEKQGDGHTWTPPVSVKGGASGFYSIGVGK